MAITAADVNKLRQQTGAGMMDCKKALTECDGDFDKAVDYLRKTGQKLAAKRADRSANEGIVFAQNSTDHSYASIVLISSETDFVAKNQDFIDFAKQVSDLSIAQQPLDLDSAKAMKMADGRSVEEHVTDMVGKIGEKIEFAQFEALKADSAFVYNHHGNRLATLVGFNGQCPEEVAHNVAKQAAAMAPIALDETSIPAEVIERELEVAREQTRQEGKPEAQVEMIAQGRLKKFYKETTLLNQEYIMDGKKTVVQYIDNEGKGAKACGFKRVMIGA